MRFKPKIRNFRCSPELDELLRNAAHEAGCAPSRLLREFVRDGCEQILNNPKLANELKRKFAIS